MNGASAARVPASAEVNGAEAFKPPKPPSASTLAMKTHADQIATAAPELLALFEQTRSFILAQRV